MKKSTAQAIAKLYNELYGHSTDETRTKAVVEEPTLSKFRSTSWEVVIEPVGINDGHAFYATPECVDISRAFKESFIVSQRDGKLIGRFF